MQRRVKATSRYVERRPRRTNKCKMTQQRIKLTSRYVERMPQRDNSRRIVRKAVKISSINNAFVGLSLARNTNPGTRISGFIMCPAIHKNVTEWDNT